MVCGDVLASCTARLRCSTFGKREQAIQLLDPEIRWIRLTGTETVSCQPEDVIAEWLRIPDDVSIHSDTARVWSYRIPIHLADASEHLEVPRGVRFIITSSRKLDIHIIPNRASSHSIEPSIMDPYGLVLKKVVSYLPLLSQVYLRPVCRMVYEITKGLSAQLVWPISDWRYRRGHSVMRGKLIRIEDAETCELCPLHRLAGVVEDAIYPEQFPSDNYEKCCCFYGLARPQLSESDDDSDEDPALNDQDGKSADPVYDSSCDESIHNVSWEELVNPIYDRSTYRKMRIWRRLTEPTNKWVQFVWTAPEGYSSCSIPKNATLVSTKYSGLTYASRDWNERLYAEMAIVSRFQFSDCNPPDKVEAILDQSTREEVIVGGQGGESFRVCEAWKQGKEKPTHFVLTHPTYDYYAPIVHELRFDEPGTDDHETHGERRVSGLYPDYPLVEDFPNPVLAIRVRQIFCNGRTIVDAVPLVPYLVNNGLRVEIEAERGSSVGPIVIAFVRRGRGGRNEILHRIEVDISSNPVQVILDRIDLLKFATHLTYEVESDCDGFTAKHFPLPNPDPPAAGDMPVPQVWTIVPESVNKNTFNDKRFCV